MKISREFTFCASHVIPNHPGKCRRLHGHNWTVTVEIYGGVSPKTGMAMDYADLKKAVMPIVARLDHRHLNWFMKLPTAENLATYFAHELVPKLGPDLVVRVRETDPTEAILDYSYEGMGLPTNEGWQAPF